MIHPQHKKGLPVGRRPAVLSPGLAGGKLVGAQDVFGPEIARADAVGTAEEPRGFLRLQPRDYFYRSLEKRLKGK